MINKTGKQASEQKYKKIVDMVIDWLDSNIDDAINIHDPLASDSADLKEKIELALDDKQNLIFTQYLVKK